MTRSILLGAWAALLLAAPASPGLAHPPVIGARQAADFEKDRADILAMAGAYKVRFDMAETTRWDPAYEPLARKLSGGHEVVRVIEDTGRRIVLQHFLVAGQGEDAHVTKHWRQDWEFEPTRVLAYADRHTWRWQEVPIEARAGAWSQTVWQVDDSPRYAGWGRFEAPGGVRGWQSSPTWRPLARRDAIRKPVYDRYLGINRHQNGPDGWVHWQDNTKLASRAGKLAPIVQESVLNTYTRFDGFDVAAADRYWQATGPFWAAVQAEWDRLAAGAVGLTVEEEADTGTVISARLLQLAEDIREGRTATPEAIAQARALIAAHVRRL